MITCAHYSYDYAYALYPIIVPYVSYPDTLQLPYRFFHDLRDTLEHRDERRKSFAPGVVGAPSTFLASCSVAGELILERSMLFASITHASEQCVLFHA